MSNPHDVIAELLSATQADTIEATAASAWQAAATAMGGIFDGAPGFEDIDARLVMPDEISGEFPAQHLVLPIEASTSDERTASAWLVFATAPGARFLNSEADNPDDQEQQTMVMASTVLGQAVREINAATFANSPAGLVLSLDEVSVDNMPEILARLEDPCLVLTGSLVLDSELQVTLVLPGGFLDIISTGVDAAVTGDAAAGPEPAGHEPADIPETEATAPESELAPAQDPTPLHRDSRVDRDEDAVGYRPPTPIGSAPTAHRAQFAPLTPGTGANTPSGIDLLAGLEMNVSVELGRTDMTVADVLALGPGSVVELERLAGEPVDILVNDRLIARGEVVVVDENFGVRVVEVIRREPRSEATG